MNTEKRNLKIGYLAETGIDGKTSISIDVLMLY